MICNANQLTPCWYMIGASVVDGLGKLAVCGHLNGGFSLSGKFTNTH